MKRLVNLLILLCMMSTIIYGSGLVGHTSQYDEVLNYFLVNHPDPDPYYVYYEVMYAYPEYVKFGMTMPDLQYANALKSSVIDIMVDLEIYDTYRIWDIHEVPDPDNPDIGTLSFGMDTHHYKYAFQFAEYLLNQADLDYPPGPNPGTSGHARGMKLALAIGYYLHLCQDIIAHNFWVPKLTATSNLGELSMLEPKDAGTELDLIPGIQSHYAIESMHDYRIGNTAAQNLKNLMTTEFWSTSSQIFRVGFYGWVNGVYFEPDIYYGRNPALQFFYEVLVDWLTNNPNNLPADYKTGPIISQNGFYAEVEIFQLMNSFYPSILGHENFPDAMLDWAEYKTDLPNSTIDSKWYDVLGAWLLDDLLRDAVAAMIRPEMEHTAAFGFQTFLGLMINDPTAAYNLAYAADTPINPAEYERLKLNPVFTDASYFNNFSYYQDLGIYYFDVVGPSGYIYTDWSPEYYTSYYWGLVNSLNGNSPALDQRFDIGVFDSYFLVNGTRFGPGIEVLPIPQCSFTAVAELFAMEEMTADLSVSIQIKLDHNTNMPANDPIIKTFTTTMRQNPADYNTVQRKKIELSFDNNDFTGYNLDDYDGIYFELFVDPSKPFYSIDWKFYNDVVQSIGDNRRYQMYTSYSMAPYSYPTNYIPFKFTNLNKARINIGDFIDVDGEDIASGANKTLTLGNTSTATATEIINYSSSDFKHNNWNGEGDDFYLDNSFEVSSIAIWNQEAKFDFSRSVNLTTNLGSADLEIHDPWYVEESGPNAGQQLNIFHQVGTGTYQGMFLDQELFDPTYYSVRAPQTQTISGIKSYFQYWEATGADLQNDINLTTPVVFRQNNAEVKALYKGHLATNNSEATANNNARRIVKDDEGVLHVVYEDNNQIWYSRSEENGDPETWSDEEWVSSYYMGFDEIKNYYPAMAVTDNTLHVVFLQDFLGSFEIKHITKDLISGDWSDERTIYRDTDLTLQSKPSIVILKDRTTPHHSGDPFNRIMVAFETESIIKIYHWEDNTQIGNWESVASFSGKTPSLSSENSGGYSQYNEAFLVYEYGGKIYGRRWSRWKKYWGYYDNDQSQWVNAGYDLTPGAASMASYINPSVTLYPVGGSETVCFLVFEIQSNKAQKNNYNQIGVRVFMLGNLWLTDISVFGDIKGNQPSISFWPYQGPSYQKGGITVFFENENHIYKRVGVIVNNYPFSEYEFEWSGQYIGQGKAPSVISNGHTGLYYYDAGAAYTSASSAPYRIKFDYRDPLDPVDPPPPFERSKSGVIRNTENIGTLMKLDSLIVYKRFDYCLPADSSNSFSLGINNAIIGKKHINFNSKLFSQSLKFKPPVSNLEFDLSCFFYSTPTVSDSNRILFDLEFHNKNGNIQTLKSLPLKDILHLNNGQEHIIPVSIDMTAFVNQKGKLFFSLDSNITEGVNIVTYPDTSIENLKMNPGKNEHILLKPEKFNLYSAYPNPFNPLTTIKFDIPEQSNITLKVFDIQGKIVAELFNGRKDVGRYTTKFDGSGLSSGVYFYEMTGNPTSGKGESFRNVKKMMLVK